MLGTVLLCAAMVDQRLNPPPPLPMPIIIIVRPPSPSPTPSPPTTTTPSPPPPVQEPIGGLMAAVIALVVVVTIAVIVFLYTRFFSHRRSSLQHPPPSALGNSVAIGIAPVGKPVAEGSRILDNMLILTGSPLDFARRTQSAGSSYAGYYDRRRSGSSGGGAASSSAAAPAYQSVSYSALPSSDPMFINAGTYLQGFASGHRQHANSAAGTLHSNFYGGGYKDL